MKVAVLLQISEVAAHFLLNVCSVLFLKTHLNLLHGNEIENKLLPLWWFYLFFDLV